DIEAREDRRVILRISGGATFERPLERRLQRRLPATEQRGVSDEALARALRDEVVEEERSGLRWQPAVADELFEHPDGAFALPQQQRTPTFGGFDRVRGRRGLQHRAAELVGERSEEHTSELQS